MEPNKVTITFTFKECLDTSAPNLERAVEDIEEMLEKLSKERNIKLIGSVFNFLSKERDIHYEMKVM